jgi:hypothetical protein
MTTSLPPTLTPEYKAILVQAIQAARTHSQPNTTQLDRIHALSQLTKLVLELDDNDPLWLAALEQ